MKHQVLLQASAHSSSDKPNDVSPRKMNGDVGQLIVDKNSGNDMKVEQIHPMFFSESMPQNVCKPYVTSATMHNSSSVKNSVLSSIQQNQQTSKPLDSSPFWNQNNLSIYEESSMESQIIKDDTNLNAISHNNSSQTPSATPHFTAQPSVSTGLPLISPVSSDKELSLLTMSSSTDISKVERKKLSPTTTSSILSPTTTSIVSPSKPFGSPKTLLASEYTVPKISLLLNENKIPCPPPRPPPLPKDQLNPPTPSITVRLFVFIY